LSTAPATEQAWPEFVWRQSPDPRARIPGEGMNQQPKLADLKDHSASVPPLAIDGENAEAPELTWAFLSELAIIGLGFVGAIAALYFGQSILMPVMAALIIGITLTPIQKFAADHRIPPVFSALLLMMVFLAALYVAAMLVIGPLTEWIAKAPELGSIIKEKLQWLDGPLGTLRKVAKTVGETAGSSAPTVAVETSLPAVVQQAATILTPAVTQFIVFVGTLLFFLIGSEQLRRQLITRFETRGARKRVLRIWNDIEHNLIRYLGTVTVINLGLGIVTAGMLFLVGFPNPVAFGALAFVLNYIPYIGPAILILTLFAVGLISTPTLGTALFPPLLFVAIATVEGQFITPGVVGHRLTMSPFLVFLALAFWTWLWGPFGTFMATPLLIVALVVLGHLFPDEEMTLPK